MHPSAPSVDVNEVEAVWQKATPAGEILSSGTVEIWRLHYPSFIKLIPALNEMFQPEEKNRSVLFYRSKDRERFIIGRGMLRQLLGNYLNMDPQAIEFSSGKNNKPALKNKLIDFNISHSGDYILIAFAKRDIGVDIEYYNPDYEFNDIMQLVFSDREISFVKKQHDPQSAFYRLWTRKEALLKAFSTGVNNHIKSLPCLEGSHLMDRALCAGIENWKVCSFKVAEQYTGSIACRADTRKILFKVCQA